jgi:Arc/MetJ-type ribon-helix-helix transcriptional regulator
MMRGSLTLGKGRTRGKVGVASDGPGGEVQQNRPIGGMTSTSVTRIADRYADRMTTQLVARVPDEIVAAIDDLVRRGVFESRSDAVRAALAADLDRRRRAEIGQAIVEGYRRVPQEHDELAWADAATAAMIAEEPW